MGRSVRGYGVAGTHRRALKPPLRLGGSARNRLRSDRFWMRLKAGGLGAARRLGPWLVGCGLAGGLGLAGVWGIRAVGDLPQFQVKTVDVYGLKRIPRKDIVTYAQAPVGRPILGLDLGRMARQIRHHPWIASVNLRRRLPDRLIIEAVEYEPTLLVSLGSLYIADTQGQLFKSFSAADRVVLPVLTGLQRDEAMRCLPCTTDRIRAGIALVQALAHSSLGHRVEELHWDEDEGWSVVLRAKQSAPSMRMYVGPKPQERLNLAFRTLQLLAQRRQTPAVIWVNGVKNPQRVHVRLAQEAL